MALILFKLKGAEIPAEEKEEIKINAASSEDNTQSIIIKKDVVTIGRGSGNDIRTTEGRVSRNHCTLIRRNNSWYVKDLKSSAGTYIYRFGAEKFIIQLLSGEFLLDKGDNIVLGGLMEDGQVLVLSFGGSK